MSHIPPLANIMVAPNGARRSQKDHPALPISVSETVATAKACYEAGARALHAHVRDANGRHVLDAGQYCELIAEMALTVPEMAVQITTESVGRYSPLEQRALVKAVNPKHASVALKEMTSEGFTPEVRDFYQQAHHDGIAIQHIIYSPQELAQLHKLIEKNQIPATSLQVLLVLGRYQIKQQSQPADLDPMLISLKQFSTPVDWAVCAFGIAETACLQYAWQQGGKARIGFENSFWHTDGSVATDNAERVRYLQQALNAFAS